MFSILPVVRTTTFASGKSCGSIFLTARMNWSRTAVAVIKTTAFERVDRESQRRQFSSINREAVSALMKDSLKDIQMRDIAQVPAPIFWTTTLGLAPIVAPSLSFFLFGFTHGLATMQMSYGALLASFFGGTQFGGYIKEGATWENVTMAVTPTIISLFGLVMPQILGFVIITSAFAFTVFTDVTSHQLPKGYRAMRLAFSIPVLGLLLSTCIIRLFH